MQKSVTPQRSSIDLLFETSWEVCNKVGGIYTVLSTKARVLQQQFGNKLIFVGPDVWSDTNPSPYFIERKTLLKSASSKMQLPEGISIRTGRWNIPGSPCVVLVKFDGAYGMLNSVFGQMWEHFKVDSLHSYGDYSEGCAFAVASAIVMKELTHYLKADPSHVDAHFNEWTTGMGLLYLRLIMPEAATLFTTHATSIGRSICGNGKNLYEYFTAYNGDQMAGELNMESKHSLEKAAAHAADCFTAVSEITARECEQLLEIRPQVVTPNGFEPDFVPGNAKYKKLRAEGRKRLIAIAEALKGRKYADDTLLIATSGRNEYRNKGLDLFLDSMAELQMSLPDGKEAIAFVLVPAWVKSPDSSLKACLEGNAAATANDYMTHSLNNEDSDPLCRRVAQLESEGRLGGKVSVVYVPCYLDGHDGIVDISYYDLLPALDITVFASYYEPWGYTPLESVAFGVPTVTTDKAGFGQWVAENFTVGLETCGVQVVGRDDQNYNEDKTAISDSVAGYAATDALQRSQAVQAAKETAEKANWKYFIAYYDEAYSIADARRLSRLAQENK